MRFFFGGSLTRSKPTFAEATAGRPETKGLVKKRISVDEYLAPEPEEEKVNFRRISSILDSEAEVWPRVHWQLSEGLFLFWYI